MNNGYGYGMCLRLCDTIKENEVVQVIQCVHTTKGGEKDSICVLQVSWQTKKLNSKSTI